MNGLHTEPMMIRQWFFKIRIRTHVKSHTCMFDYIYGKSYFGCCFIIMSFIKNSLLNKNNILYRHQCGFRPKHCTMHPIMHLLHQCANAISTADPEFTLAVLCDLSKAFDVTCCTFLSNGGSMNKIKNKINRQLLPRKHTVICR